MAFEKRWAAVPPQNFTTNGTSTGKITVADSSVFKVKQQVVVVSNTETNLNLQVQRIDTATELYVGPSGSSITTRTDMSAYTTADVANIYAIEQPRSSVPEEQVERLTYEEEPTVARRVVLVDKLGNKVDSANPLPVDATFTGDIHVKLTDKDNDPNPGDEADAVQIGNGVNRLDVNSDGSINVQILTSTSNPGLVITHNEITAVPASIETTVLTLVAVGSYRVKKIEVSGTNVALFRVKVNGSTVVNKRSWWTNFNQTFDFENFDNGLLLNNGDTLLVTTIHERPDLGDFEATVMAN